MKIGMIVNSFPTISEKFIINQIVALKRKFPVESSPVIFSSTEMENDESSVSQNHRLFYEAKLEDNLVKLNIPRNMKKRMLRLIPVFFKMLFTHPLVLFDAISVRRWKTMALNGKVLYYAWYFYSRKLHFDVIHCQFGQNGFVGAFLKRYGFCDRLIVTFHGSDITVFPKKHKPRVYKSVFDCVDIVTCGTNFIKSNIIKNGCSESKIKVLPVGGFPDDYEQKSYVLNKENLILVSVGRLVDLKGFEYSINAVALIKDKVPGLKYFIVGDGSPGYKKNLEEKCNSLGIQDKVVFTGNKIDTEILQIYQDCDVLIFPSIRADNGAEEGQGLVIQEAEAAGLPVIASNIGGIPEGLQDGVTGFLVPEKNPEAIAEYIMYFSDNREKIAEFGKRARDFALKNYDCDVLADRLIEMYKGI